MFKRRRAPCVSCLLSVFVHDGVAQPLPRRPRTPVASPLHPPIPHCCCFFPLPFPQVLRKVSGNQQIANQAASLRVKSGGQMRRRSSDPSKAFFLFCAFLNPKMCDFPALPLRERAITEAKKTTTLEPVRPNGETDTSGWLSSHCSDLCIFFQAEAAF